MNKKLGFVLSFILLVASVQAKDPKYAIKDIPPALKENAHTIVRLKQIDVEIKSEKEAIVNITEVRTILNKNGLNDSYFMESYSPMMKIRNLNGKIYDQTGKQVKLLSSDDAEDYSLYDGFSLYQDNRIIRIDPKYMNYPFTVEYNYQMNYKQTLFLPSWNHNDENTSYENSVLNIKAPIGYPLRYKEYNIPNSLVRQIKDGKDIYNWTISNLKVRTNEPMASFEKPDYPMVRLAPTNFSIGETSGSAESWNKIGNWVTTLLLDKDKLLEATVTKVKELTNQCKTDLDKVKVVYEFMQQKTRYVSIQVGIGGWKPFEASIVDKYSYGDCKALSNYTKALLSVIGIKSYYICVDAGESTNNINVDFPMYHFNHAMLCVPLEKDTVWLECTSQRLPCGFNSDFTDDRNVLLVDGENSKLVHTRIYPVTENCINRKSTVKLQDENNGVAKVSSDYIGLSYEEILPVYYADDANKKKIITNRIKLPSFTLDNFSYTETRSKTPVFNEKFDISLMYYIKKLPGDLAILPLNFINKHISVPEKVRNRKTEMCIRRAFMENDTVHYELPKEFIISELPANQTIASQFGKYSSVATKSANTITFIRHFELIKAVFPPESYAEYRDFMEQVTAADDAVATLKKL